MYNTKIIIIIIILCILLFLNYKNNKNEFFKTCTDNEIYNNFNKLLSDPIKNNVPNDYTYNDTVIDSSNTEFLNIGHCINQLTGIIEFKNEGSKKIAQYPFDNILTQSDFNKIINNENMLNTFNDALSGNSPTTKKSSFCSEYNTIGDKNLSKINTDKESECLINAKCQIGDSITGEKICMPTNDKLDRCNKNHSVFNELHGPVSSLVINPNTNYSCKNLVQKYWEGFQYFNNKLIKSCDVTNN